MKKCQVFTPEKIALFMLDQIKYEGNVFGKKVLENSFGNGVFLKEIVRIYIESCIKKGISSNNISQGLSNDIVGFEIDFQLYNTCVIELNQITQHYNIPNVKWNLKNSNYLNYINENTFDIIIGNPPYIKYSDLSIEERTILKSDFKSCCKGKFDYCYAFIEKSIRELNETGCLCYLVPNSIFKNVFGYELRKIMHPNITDIIDCTSKTIFSSALVSPTIFVYKTDSNSNIITYRNYHTKKTYHMDRSKLGSKWIFSEKYDNAKKVRFGDIYNAATSIATQYNAAFIIKEYEDYGNYLKINDYLIEKNVTRPAASPKSMKLSKNERIIFPYYYSNGDVKHYSESEFKEKFPQTYEYLLQFKPKLICRDSDKNGNWFEYGRSQAIGKINCPKLIISTVITKSANVFTLSNDYIPYSGIYITCSDNNKILRAKDILESDNFADYVKKIGISASGTSIRITSHDINNYTIDEEE